MKLDPATFTDIKGVVDSWFADPSTLANKATAWTVGVNWYLTQNVEWVLDYTVTRFDGGAADGKGSRGRERLLYTIPSGVLAATAPRSRVWTAAIRAAGDGRPGVFATVTHM
jgi:hypothetical protein